MANQVFISYAHADERLKDEFLSHLTSLKREDLVEAWHDRMLRPGEHLEQAVERELAASDVVLLLISAAFLSSSFCIEKEMVRAVERSAVGEAKAIAIIVKPCQWMLIPVGGDTRLGDLVALPLDAKPVTTFSDRNVAWAQIVGSLRAVLAESTSHQGAALQATSVDDGGDPAAEPSMPDRPTPRPLSSDRTFIVYMSSEKVAPGQSGLAVVDVAAEYADDRDGRVVVVGHADRGEASVALSRRRAMTIAARLIELGISEERLEIGWLGAADPAIGGGQGHEVLDRRVMISIE